MIVFQQGCGSCVGISSLVMISIVLCTFCWTEWLRSCGMVSNHLLNNYLQVTTLRKSNLIGARMSPTLIKPSNKITDKHECNAAVRRCSRLPHPNRRAVIQHLHASIDSQSRYSSQNPLKSPDFIRTQTFRSYNPIATYHHHHLVRSYDPVTNTTITPHHPNQTITTTSLQLQLHLHLQPLHIHPQPSKNIKNDPPNHNNRHRPGGPNHDKHAPNAPHPGAPPRPGAQTRRQQHQSLVRDQRRTDTIPTRPGFHHHIPTRYHPLRRSAVYLR